jgi:alkylation response protein AidB-like acyl-CoA dehydrogenase
LQPDAGVRWCESAPSDGRSAPYQEAIALGVGRAACEAAVAYAKLRVQGGRPIVEHQAIGRILADAAVRLTVARGVVWQAAWASDHPQAYAERSLPDLPLQAVAQVYTGQAVHEAVELATECFGAMGVMRDMPLAKYMHDARICVQAGTTGIAAKFRIAEALVGYRRGASGARG